MAKRVYFAFHYQDVINFRANVVRQHWVTKPDREAAGFFDASLWEKAKGTSPLAVKRLINSAIDGTSVTCVLIGTETYARPWVRYEILKSLKKGKSLFAVHINSIPDKSKLVRAHGPEPFVYLGISFSQSGETATLMEYSGSAWRAYTEIDGSASYELAKKAAPENCGKFCKLSQLYPTYDWVASDGYNKFSSWVG